jgi:hypothetical protein
VKVLEERVVSGAEEQANQETSMQKEAGRATLLGVCFAPVSYFAHHLLNRPTILWRIHPLLGKDLETNNEATAVAMQRRDKYTSTTIELLLETVFSTRSLQRIYEKDSMGGPVNPMWRRGRIPSP